MILWEHFFALTVRSFPHPNRQLLNTPSLLTKIHLVRNNQRMNSNKGFVHLLLLIVVVLVGIGGLLYFSWQKGLIKTSPTKEAFPTPTMVINETANLSRDDIIRNWKTYTNTKYSYSLKYPLELTYNENSNGDVSFFLLGDDQRKDTPNGLGQHLSIVHRRESP